MAGTFSLSEPTIDPPMGMDCWQTADYFIELPFCLCSVCGKEDVYSGLVPKGWLSLGGIMGEGKSQPIPGKPAVQVALAAQILPPRAIEPSQWLGGDLACKMGNVRRSGGHSGYSWEQQQPVISECHTIWVG